MIDFEPQFTTFDCYGTAVNFRMADMTQEIYSNRLKSNAMERFVKLLAAHRRDEVLGASFHAAITAEDAQAHHSQEPK